MKSDLEIAHSIKLKPIEEIAAAIGLKEGELEHYGKEVAKVDLSVLNRLKRRRRSFTRVPSRTSHRETAPSLPTESGLNWWTT